MAWSRDRCQVLLGRAGLCRVPLRRVFARACQVHYLVAGETIKQSARERGDDSSRLLERITIDPEVCHGKPCVRGLRYPVDMILTLLSAGMSGEEILSDYDDLGPDDILAALAFAARLCRVKRVRAVVSGHAPAP